MVEPAQQHAAYVILVGPGHNGTCLVLREGITSFGRLPSNDVILLGDLVSRHHTRITFFEGRATLQDLGSHNGSWVNGERVTTRVLKEGDVGRIGNFRISYHLGPPPEHLPASFDETTAAEEARRSAAAKRPEIAQAPTRSPGGMSGGPAAVPQSQVSVGSRSAILHQLDLARTGHDAQTKALHLLVRATDALAKSHDVQGYLAEMLSIALEQSGAELAAYFESRSGGPQLIAARGPKGAISDPQVAMSVIKWVLSKNFEVMSDDVGKDMRFPDAARHADKKPSVLAAPVGSGEKVVGALYVARSHPFHDEELDAITALAHLTGAGVTKTISRSVSHSNSDLRARLARVFAPEIANSLSGEAIEPALESKNGTLLSIDLPGFGSIAERLQLSDASSLLNNYLGHVWEAASKHKALLLPTCSTELRVLFASPNPGQDAAKAVTLALEVRAATDALFSRLPSDVPRRVRVGVASGWLLAGLAGGPNRIGYTVIGDTVDLAVRLQAMASPGAILLVESTYLQVQELFEARRLQTRGADGPSVFELVGKKGRARAG